jgi:putative peptide zinc metalloprotease protein
MPTAPTTNTPDLSQIVLKLRDDLSIVPQTIDGKKLYVVEDRLTGKCFRLGAAEYEIARSLDGRTSLAEVIGAEGSSDDESTGRKSDVLRISQWLLKAGLARIANAAAAQPQQTSQPQNLLRANPIFFRIPLLAPDHLLERSSPWLGWLNSATALRLSTVLFCVAATHLIAGWSRFLDSASGILAIDQSLYLLLGWIGLKFAHELGHGLACKRYGGYVREAGVAMLLFAPIPYVDVTSSWRLRSKWARIHIAAAGMYVEAILGSLAVLVWSYTGPGVLNQLCVNVVVMATLSTFLFNANPLMRFDGYYILADFLEVPNLYARGQQFVAAFCRRWLLGDKTATVAAASRFVKTYGLAACCWRMFVCVSLVLAASALFHGAGIVLAAFACLAWFVAPAHRFLRGLWDRRDWHQIGRFAIASTAIATGLLLFFTLVPWPFPHRAPGIVEYEPITVVRAESPGFIRELRVSPGQVVQTGDVLVLLDNEELRDELRILELSIEEAKLRGRLYRQRREMAAHQAEMEQLAALQKQRETKRAEVGSLAIRAPTAGQVIGRTLPLLLDAYLQEGQELCRIGQEADKEIQLSIHQDDVGVYRERLGREIAIRGPSGLIFAPLATITPRATDQPTHPALCSSHGGPLPVQADPDEDSVEEVRLLQPRFVGRVALNSEQSELLRAGQHCTVMVRSPDESVGTMLSQRIRDWVDVKLQR